MFKNHKRKFPNNKDRLIKVQKAYRIPYRLPYNNQNTKHTEQRKNITNCRSQVRHKGRNLNS